MHTCPNFAGSGFCICPICTVRHSESGLRLVPVEAFLGWALCEGCEGMHAAGYVACIEVIDTPAGTDEATQLASAERTGEVYSIHRDAWNDYIGDHPLPERPMIFVLPGLGAQLAVALGIMSPTVH